MILVVGASGALGLEMCRQLHARSHPRRVLVCEGSTATATSRGLGCKTTTTLDA